VPVHAPGSGFASTNLITPHGDRTQGWAKTAQNSYSWESNLLIASLTPNPLANKLPMQHTSAVQTDFNYCSSVNRMNAVQTTFEGIYKAT